MHLLRFFLTHTSVPEFGCAQAGRRIRVLTQPPRPLSWLSTDTRAALGSTAHTANPLFSAHSQTACDPNCHSNPIAHRVRRKRQRLPPSLLIENASERLSCRPKVSVRGVSDQG